MAGTLIRKTRKEVFSQRGKVVSSMFLVFIAVFSYVMFSSIMPMMRATIDQTYETYAAPDFMAVAYSAPRSHIAGVGDIDGVEAFTSRYHVFGDITYSGGTENPADLYGIDATTPPDVFRLLLSEGSYLDPTDNRSALVEKAFATSHGISVGSTLTVSLFGEEHEVNVVGIAVSLEHLFPHRNPKQLIHAPSRASFSAIAPVWVDISVIQELSYTGYGEKDVVNEILVRFEEEYDYTDLAESVLDAISPYPIVTTLDISELRSAELQRFEAADEFILLFAGIIYAVAAFVVYSTVKRIVEFNSREIGITKSLGYTTSEIKKAYLLTLGTLAFVASLIALPLGEPAGHAILQSFAGVYSLEILAGATSPMVYIVALVAGVLTVLLSAYFPVRKISGYEPIRAIRGWMMEKGYVGETVLERIGRKLGIKGYGFKFVARGISLNKVRASLMVVGIALAAGVATMGSLMIGGFNTSIVVYLDQNEHWDLLMDFKEPMNSTEIDALMEQVSDIDSYEPYLKLGTTAVILDRSRLVSLLCLNAEGQLHDFNLESGRTIQAEDEALVDITVADSIGVREGDIVNLTVGSSTELFTIVGVVSSPMNVFYISLGEATDLLGTEMISGLFVKVVQGADPLSVADAIFSLDDVENSMTKTEASSGLISEAQGVAVAIGIAAVAMLLLLAVVWNIVSISVGERISELAQLEAIGWSRNTLTRLLFVEITIVTLIGVVLSIPFGQVISGLFDSFLKSYIPFYVASIDVISVVSVVVLTFVTAILATLPSARKLRRIDVDRVIRDRQMT
ncbi:MAG: FtsX-like permease family protein [Candidatus Thorarchaeota archaeon]|nr:MAG: FtsX-like permease family protein [Candidatus Thorarchaeota archaeon]